MTTFFNKTWNFCRNYSNIILNSLLVFISLTIVFSFSGATMLFLEFKLDNYSYLTLFIFVFCYSIAAINIVHMFFSHSKIHPYFSSSSIVERVVLSIFISYIIVKIFILSTQLVIGPDVLLSMSNNTPAVNNNQDPVRWWPSGTAQNWGIIGSALAAYRVIPGSPKYKAAAALGTLGVTVPLTIFTAAVENPQGFNRLIYSWIEYNKTGVWGAVPATVTNQAVETKFVSASNTQITDYVSNVSNNVGDTSSNNITNNLVGKDIDPSEYFNSLSLDSLFKSLLSLFRLETLDGYFDELYGFIWFTQVLLFIIAMSLLVITVLYIIINVLLLNKEKIVNKLNPENRFLKFYLKYQIVLAHISFYVLPILIILGLIEMIFILNYLITHPLPLENLNIDTHVYISKSK